MVGTLPPGIVWLEPSPQALYGWNPPPRHCMVGTLPPGIAWLEPSPQALYGWNPPPRQCIHTSEMLMLCNGVMVQTQHQCFWNSKKCSAFENDQIVMATIPTHCTVIQQHTWVLNMQPSWSFEMAIYHQAFQTTQRKIMKCTFRQHNHLEPCNTSTKDMAKGLSRVARGRGRIFCRVQHLQIFTFMGHIY